MQDTPPPLVGTVKPRFVYKQATTPSPVVSDPSTQTEAFPRANGPSWAIQMARSVVSWLPTSPESLTHTSGSLVMHWLARAF